MFRCPIPSVLLAMLTLTAGIQAADPPSPDKLSKNVPAADRLQTAYRLIDFGRATSSPVALLTAGEILSKTPTRPLKDLDAHFAAQLGQEDKAETPDALVAEARKLSDAPAVVAMADRLTAQFKEKAKPLVDGPFTQIYVMEPGTKELASPLFKGGQWAEVRCQVLGDGVLELKASDPKAGLDLGDTCNTPHLRWLQKDDGRVNIIRRNVGTSKIRVYVVIP